MIGWPIAEAFGKGVWHSLATSFLTGVLSSVLVVAPLQAQKKVSDGEGIESALRELSSRLAREAPCQKETNYTVGLWKLDGSKIPLPQTTLDRIYSEVVARLVRLQQTCSSLIDSAAIGAIMGHLVKSGAIDRAGGNEIAAIQEIHQDVRFLIFPNIYTQGTSYLISFRLLEKASARTVAQSKPVALPASWVGSSPKDAALTVDMAADAVAENLLAQMGRVKALENRGIFFGDSQSQPAGARFLRDRIEAKMIQRLSNSATSSGVRLRGIKIEAQTASNESADAINEDSIARRDGVAILSGRYWLRDEVVELRVTMTMPDSQVRAWQGAIRKSEFGKLELENLKTLHSGAQLKTAGYSFQLTTSRGKSPTYRPGESLVLILHSNKNVFVYCFYADSRGNVIPILPTPGRPEASNTLVANRVRHVPDAKVDTFVMKLTADTLGEEKAVCYASPRDLRNQLPNELFRGRLEPVPLLRLGSLGEVFTALGDDVAEASVTLTVVE